MLETAIKNPTCTQVTFLDLCESAKHCHLLGNRCQFTKTNLMQPEMGASL